MCSDLLRGSVPPFPNAGPPAGNWPTLLVVEHDAELLQTLVCFFEKRGFHVAASSTLDEAKTFFHRRQHWTMVITDSHLSDGTGWDLCSWVREQRNTPPPFLLMSDSSHGEISDEVDLLPKPFALDVLESRVRGRLLRA